MNKIKFFTANSCASWIISWIGYHFEKIHVDVFISDNRYLMTIFETSPDDDVLGRVQDAIKENGIFYDKMKGEWLHKANVMTLDIIWNLSD